jgi:hypothetical protein
VATRDESVRDPESLVRLAEAALEAAQKAGRNRVHLAMTVQAPAAGATPEAAAS